MRGKQGNFRGKCAENKQNPSAVEATTNQSKPAGCLSVNTDRGRKAESHVQAKVNRRSEEEAKPIAICRPQAITTLTHQIQRSCFRKQVIKKRKDQIPIRLSLWVSHDIISLLINLCALLRGIRSLVKPIQVNAPTSEAEKTYFGTDWPNWSHECRTDE